MDEQTKADALAACDIFCMPSDSESIGIVYVEAWPYGKVVIGGPAPAACELIQDGVGGLYIAQTEDAIAEAVVRLRDDGDLRRRLREAGRQKQRERFTWDAVLVAREAALLKGSRATRVPARLRSLMI